MSTLLKHYNTLGISRNSSLEEIKKTYKKLALQHHPDHTRGDSSKFIEIQEAYEYLLENHKTLKKSSSSAGMFSDMFKTLKKEPIKNHVIRLNISLKEALEGVEKTLKIKLDIPCTECSFVTRDRCKICRGVGYIKEEKVGAFLFKNITNQNQTYLYKKYYKDINLHIKINVLSDDVFYLKKDTIYSDVPLNIFQAMLGGPLKVTTPRRTTLAEIPAGKIKDFSYRLKEEGFSGKDFIINFKVFLPDNLTLSQKNMLRTILDEKNKE